MALHLAKRTNPSRSGRANIVRIEGSRIAECDTVLRDRLEMDAWDGDPAGLRHYFSFRFRALPDDFPAPKGDGTSCFEPRDAGDEARLCVTCSGSDTVIRLSDPRAEHPMGAHVEKYRDQTRRAARWILARIPHPTWIIDGDGKLAWGNAAYHQLETNAGGARADRRPVICPDDDTVSFPDKAQHRIRFQPGPDAPDRWFDIGTEEAMGMRLHHGIDVTAVVRAETAQRAFVQTLTKTFAQLSIGLAIFDRHRRLALFNPALIDLTALSPDFLSGRPDHLSFFDRLRNEMIMPEPRDYTTWRDKIIDVIAAAENGSYEETWTLPHGSTYRVTGRPHPNGAVAFLFEDISAEVTLTRRFREQIDLSQAAMDSLDDALAVFSPQGVLSYTNTAYRELWNIPGEDRPLDLRVSEVSRTWQEHCDPDPVWGDFRDFAVGFEERTEWDARVRMQDGRGLDCRFKPLQGGATLAAFRVVHAPHLVEIHNTG
ncbi:PAS-domain containing protein [Pseudooceanicola batsensis]|nr:PAS-domain containing protein [Pseudooceanicola batsensis]